MLGQRYLQLDYKGADPARFRRRMRYASFVSKRHGLLYVETPKAACTSLKWLMAHLEGERPETAARGMETQMEMSIHFRDTHPLPSLTDLPPPDATAILQGSGYLRFCAVRNPYTRLIAAWSNKIRQIEPGYSAVCAEIHAFHGRTSCEDAPSFRDFALWVVAASDPDTCDGHWRAQTKLLYPEVINYDFVLKTESLAADLQRVFDAGATTRDLDARAILAQFKYNESLPFGQAGLFDEDLARQVAAHYADDFRTFGYDVESWRKIADRKPPSYDDLEKAALAAVQQRNKLIESLTAKKPKARKKLLKEVVKLFGK